MNYVGFVFSLCFKLCVRAGVDVRYSVGLTWIVFIWLGRYLNPVRVVFKYVVSRAGERLLSLC